MAKKVDPAPQGRRSTQSKQALASARRGGPGRTFWLGAGGIVVIGVALLAWQAGKPKATSREIDPTLPKLKAEGYVLGSPSAPVEVVEFADFECPSCGQYSNLTEPDVRTKLVNTGQVRIRYMDFPLSMHKNTWDASFAAACANEQGKFWPMHDMLFQNQDRWNGEATSNPKKEMRGYAESLGLDMTKYNACVDSEKFRAQIQANEQEGERRGVGQTPTFMIGNTIHPGALPWDAFKKLVDDETARVKGAPAAAAAPADSGKKGK